MGTNTEQPAKTKTRAMLEMIRLNEATLDDESHKARVTLITPGWSNNGRYYSKDVIASSAGLWEGAKAYRDHPTKAERNNRPERSISDLVGVYENIVVEQDGRLTADLLVEDEGIWNKLKFAASKRPDYLGLSINAIGSTRPGRIDGRSGEIVESIVKAYSTDIVTAPAAGGKIESLYMSDGGGLASDIIEAMPLDELKETLNVARQDLMESLQKEWKTVRDTEALKAARDETARVQSALTEAEDQVKKMTADNAALQGKLAEAENKLASAKREAMLETVLASSKLPASWAKSLKETLLEADPRKWEAIVKMEMDKARTVPAKVSVTGAPAHTQLTIKPATAKTAINPVAESLGIDPELAKAQNFNDYMRIKRGK